MTASLVARLGATADPVTRSLAARVDLAYAMIEARLGETPYFAGDALTAADIMMLFPLTTLRRFTARDLSDHPNVPSYLRRIGQRPAYRRAMKSAESGMDPLLI